MTEQFKIIEEHPLLQRTMTIARELDDSVTWEEANKIAEKVGKLLGDREKYFELEARRAVLDLHKVVKYKLLNENAKKPMYATDGAAGADIFAAEDVEIGPGQSVSIATGLSVEIPSGYELQIRPRSGIAFKNGVYGFFGTIDEDYRGEIKVLLYNSMKDKYFAFHKGDRIAQAVLAKVEKAKYKEADSLSDTERGEGGFGSTGTR